MNNENFKKMENEKLTIKNRNLKGKTKQDKEKLKKEK